MRFFPKMSIMKLFLHHASALRAAVIGLVGLGAAIGIGRFAFTPMMPLMQVHGGLSLTQGGQLASANYLGYLIGGLLCFALNPRPAMSAKLGLTAVAVSTLAMALTSSFWAWTLLRFVAGIASALVFVGISAWALALLAQRQRATWSGWVFAGVGTGILFAGLVALVVGALGVAPASGWLFLGCAASAVAILAARSIKNPAATADEKQQATVPRSFDRSAWRLVVCYAAFGFGYIIPATFLPAASRVLIDNPTVFGWTWPVFGVAAAVSTVVARSVLRSLTPRHGMAFGQIIMAAGVALPAVDAHLVSMIISAVCVGGTFMVVTMAGMMEARRVAADSAPRLMAAMTTAFAAGQLVGPLAITGTGSVIEAMRVPSLLAAALLFFAALALLPELKSRKRLDDRASRKVWMNRWRLRAQR
jgi:predicted MFS family arabinose efflux permease